MPPLEQPPERYFVIQLHADGGWSPVIRIKAERACEPKTAADKWMVFKSGDDIVGKVQTNNLAAWWVEENDPGADG